MPDATSFFPVGGMPTASSLPFRKTSSPKSQDAVALQQIKERGALPMIDRGDIRQAIDRCSNIWASLPGAGYGQFEHKADSLIAKFKEAGGTVREIDVWAVTAIISFILVICIIVCLSWAVNHYRDNAITYKAQRDKNARELKLANAAITDMQMRQRDVAALDAKYTKELLMPKLKMMLMGWCCRWSSSVAHQSSLSVSAATTASGVDNAASPWLADTAERGLFHPQREADHYAKTTGRNPEVY